MPRTPILLMALCLAGLPALGCGRTDAASSTPQRDSVAAFDLAAARREIEARNRRFTQAHVIGDSVAMVDIFTDDARVLAPNADPVIGRAAIEALTAQYLTYGITEFSEETVAFYGNAEMLIDEGTYVMVYDHGRTREQGKYVNIWRKERGEWRIHSNMWNANAPRTAPPR